MCNEIGEKGSITLDGKTYSFKDFADLLLPKPLHWAKASQDFVQAWLSNNDHFELHTSGSSGKPKLIRLHREQLNASALATITSLQLPAHSHALVAMDTAFIGGKMMLVRGLIGHWHLHLLPPTTYPIPDESIAMDFTALVPLQVEGLLKTKEGIAFLNRLSKLIIGGAPIQPELQEKIQSLKCEVWHSYGMTETVSHIALKKLNGTDASESFKVIGDNEVKLNDQGCLCVRGTVTQSKWIETNDLAEITKNGFVWIGRSDLTVNSGGVKINIESAESHIRQKLTNEKSVEIALWKIPHTELGEELVGIVNDMQLGQSWKTEYTKLKTLFQAYHFPKRWFFIDQMRRTGSGKIDRIVTLRHAKEVTIGQ